MKKLLVFLAAFFLLSSAAYAADLNFEPVGGGKFIYCNNPEGIDDNTLMNGENPSYIMNNNDLGPGTYYLYISHFNYTGNGSLGRDIEVDVELTPSSGSCSYTIENAAFENMKETSWYENGVWKKYENDWGMINCCAKMLGHPIYDIDGGHMYSPYKDGEFTPKSYSGTDTKWLSQNLPGYSVIHFAQGVHIQAIITITEGTMDINVCAFRASDTLGDRSSFDPENTAFGIYRYDYCSKGIADTLPQMKAQLSYEIDDKTPDQTYLPVTVYNQYAPDGNTLTEWFTNLNPQSDPWSKPLAAESDMITLKYEDENKLSYYGSKAENKDTVWIFDTKHSATTTYDASYGTGSQEYYSPNFELTTDRINNDYACNLGNYGVQVTYELSISNTGNKTRYFEYAPTCTSNIIAWIADKDGNYDNAYTKTLKGSAVLDIMDTIALPPGQTTEFSVNMILPVNFNGGIKNAFIISDTDNHHNAEKAYENKPKYNEYPPIMGKYLSYVKDKLPKETLKQFEGNLNCYEIIKGSEGYLVRWCAWDGKYNYYSNVFGHVSSVLALDEDFNIKGKYSFSSLPWAMSVYQDEYYINTASGDMFKSSDGLNWTTVTGFNTIPFDVYFRDIIDTDGINIDDWENITELSQTQKEELYTLIGDIKLKKVDSITYGEENIIQYRDGFYTADGYDDFIENCLSTLIEFNKDSPTPSQWAKNDLITAMDMGLVPSDLKNSSNITVPIQRESFCELAAHMLKYLTKLPDTPSSVFTDTDNMSILQLADLNIINGYEDGTFRPEALISRSEAAVILSRMMDYFKIYTTEMYFDYSDSSEIGDWAMSGVQAVSNAGIMNGTGDNCFSPIGYYTREQSIVTILRLFNCIVSQNPSLLPELPKHSQAHYAIYRENYRNGRTELALFDTENDSTLINTNGAIGVSGTYTNDAKYYYSCGKWILFEEGYDKISNNADLLKSDLMQK